MTRAALITLALALFACPSRAQVDIIEAFPNLPAFTQPVEIQSAHDGSDRLFVIERAGRIFVFDNDRYTPTRRLFLDISGAVDSDDPEEGLLGLAFHHEYPDSPYFYVNYTTTGPSRTKIARFTTSADPDSADAASEIIIMDIERPQPVHNAGALFFGPQDNYLYITTGDGGTSGTAQDRTSWLGSILRINVDDRDSTYHYAIPPDNPYAGNAMGFKEEIWAYGFRNPFRATADPLTNRVWAGDVGTFLYEEVDTVIAGGNYGWDEWEGPNCMSPPCDTSGVILPVWAYAHGCCSRVVTGGYVYRGTLITEWIGKYVFGDYLTGDIWTLELTDTGVVHTSIADTGHRISTFGVDEANNIFFASYFQGRLYRFQPTATAVGDTPPSPQPHALAQNVPNPFNPETVIGFYVSRPARVELSVYDVRGRLVRTLVDRHIGAGPHSASWDGRSETGLSQTSGVYFYRLLVGGQAVATRRMVLLK